MKILIISDVHANLVALEAVLADCGPVDAVWNLGDTIGYGPKPRECLARVRDIGADPFLVGNHDLAAIGAIGTADFNAIARLANQWTSRQLAPEDVEFLRNLPVTTTAAGITLAHGSPRSPVWEYVVDEATATENFDHFATNLCLIGHSHVALYATLPADQRRADLFLLQPGDTIDFSAGRWLVNPGSVGQPRDHDPRAAYAILDTDRATITAHRVPYDIAATQRQMTDAGLPRPLIERLALGR
jgi:diadenosine tetraphosphatase ApaH/serine/threonine PP2A family protein phosphatase